MNTIETLDAISRCNNNCTDYRIAKMMGVSTSRVSNWRNGKNSMDDEARIAAAKLLNQDPETQLVYGQMERTKCPEVKSAWMNLIERSKVAGFILALFLTFGMTFTNFEGATVAAAESANGVYYVK